jgi:two-component system nitrogen regulation response regulator GlnG
MEESRGRILLVDDDQAITVVVAELLRQEGYAVTTVGDMALLANLEAAVRAHPDCVLLDGADNGRFGASWDTAAVLARRPRPIPVIMSTAHTRDIEEAVTRRSSRSLTARFAAVVAKPFDLAVLLAAVASAVAPSRSSTGAMQSM